MASKREPAPSLRMRKIALVMGETEVCYINLLKTWYKSPVRIVSHIEGTKITPSLVEKRTRELKISQWDKVHTFLMYDMDVQAINEKLRKCKAEMLLSNPCFEIWLLLHAKDQKAAIETDALITIAYYALVQKGAVKGGDDARNAQWYAIGEIPQLAFDHEKILRVAMKRLKEQIHFQPIGFELLPEIFTMPQLQALYESILEVHFDRRNFANKILKLGILEETGDRPKNAARIVPVQYRFNLDKYKEMKSKGFRLEF